MTRGSGMLGRVAFVVVAAGLVVLGVAVSVVVTLVVDDKKAGLQDEVLNAAALRAERLEARLALAEAELGHLAGDLLAGRVEDAVRQATVGLADAVLATVDGAELVEASRDEAALAALRGWSGSETRGLAGPYVAVAVTREHVRVRGVVSWTPRALPEGWRLTVDEGAPVTALTARREGDAAVARAPVAPGLALRLEAPLGPARAAVGRLAWRVVAWSSFALVPLLVLAWVLSRAVTSPLRRLAQAVGGWNEGKALDPGPLPRNEIGELGDAIGAMSARVHADATALRAAVRFGRGARSDDTPAGVLGALRGVLRDALPGWRVVRPAEHQERAFDAARRPDWRGFGASLPERESEPSSVRLTLPGGGETIAVEDDGVVVGAVENVLPSPPAELRLARLFARTAEARLRIARLARKSRAQAKLASAGKLAAAVTHEMNTPLAYLQANLETLGEALGPAHRELVEDSLLGVARLTRILQDLSATTAGGSLGAFEATDLRAVAGDVLRMAETRGSSATLRLEAPGGIPVECDRGRIEQVLLNLVKNALDVVGAEGTVTLRLGQEGERVFAQVEDDGPGIPAEVRDHLFEAFFTTKGDGGTGLGLALSRSFVEAHGGTLDVAGTGPEGTVFRLELPARAAPENRPRCGAAAEDAPSDAPAPLPEAAAPAEAAPVPEAAAPVDAALGSEPRDRPRVLVVDDEPALVRALARWLRADATVTGVTSPSAALSRLAEERFDLLLCDLHMPELGGDALARKVRALPNAPRVVVMTGSAAPAPEDLTYVRKPLDRAQLRAVLAG